MPQEKSTCCLGPDSKEPALKQTLGLGRGAPEGNSGMTQFAATATQPETPRGCNSRPRPKCGQLRGKGSGKHDGEDAVPYN